MKKTLLVAALFFIPFCGISQARKAIDSFMGIPFGSDSVTFKKAITAKGAHFLANKSSVDFLEFDNLTLNKRNNITLLVNFINNKFYEADLVYPNEPGPMVITYYNELIKDINQIYGLGADHNTFTTSYQQSDGDEINAIKAKKATYMHFWLDQSNNNKLVITIDPSLKVFMVYQDADLAELAANNK